MAMQIKIVNHAPQALSQMQGNIKAALNAMGLKAVGMIREQMISGYGKPIRQTGNLIRDVNHAVENHAEKTVDVGNGLYYAPFVHEGTSRMAGRPYITDAISGGAEELKQVAAQYLKKGF